jgi:hypothetical protein
MEIYTKVPSAATWEALGKLSQWLDSDSKTRCCVPLLHFAAPRSKTASCMIATGR